METFLGQIIMFGGTFAPMNWAFCNGDLLSISDHNALFSLIGTIYGGDGRTTFALPDLRGRAPIHYGTGPGLTRRPIGQRAGEESHYLIINEMPSHMHTTQGQLKVSSVDSTKAVATNGSSIATPGTPAGRAIAKTYGYNDMTPDVTLNLASNQITNGFTGGNHPHNNMQPFLAINFIIALNGIYPTRS